MKCDHLIGRTFDGDVYILASDVMEAVSELKQKLENVQASMYCDVVCDGVLIERKNYGSHYSFICNDGRILRELTNFRVEELHK